MKVTIKDIAKAAGVANSTVTNALNPDSKKISESKRQEILKIVQEMEYVPMKSAQNLAIKNKKIIGLFIRSSDNFLFDIINQKLIHYMNLTSNQKKIEIINIFTSEDNSESYDDINEKVKSYNFTDIVIHGLDKENEILKKVLKLPGRKILLEIPFTNKTTTFISTNNFLAQQELIYKICNENNIQNILYIPGDPKAYVSIERLRGFESATKKLKIKNKIIDGTFDKSKIDHIIKDIDFLEFDLICCGSDLVAIEIVKKLELLGIKNKVVSGFDGNEIINYFDTKIYTVYQQIDIIVKEIIEMIISNNYQNKLVEYKIIKNN